MKLNKADYTRINASKWNAMSTEEREAYLSENRDRGNKRYSFSPPTYVPNTLILTYSNIDYYRLDFRFIH